MKFQITKIDFDCSLDCDDDWSESDQIETEELLQKSYIGKIFEVDDEEDLVDLISDQSGWCISHIDYRDVTV